MFGDYIRQYYSSIAKWVSVFAAASLVLLTVRKSGKDVVKADIAKKEREYAEKVIEQKAIIRAGSADVAGMRRKLSARLRKDGDS